MPDCGDVAELANGIYGNCVLDQESEDTLCGLVGSVDGYFVVVEKGDC